VDVRDLVEVESVMKETGLGPNGSTIYCMEYLEKNFDWLRDEILEWEKENEEEDYTYIIVDCPGQVELVTHHESLERIIKRLKEEMEFELCAVHLVDSNFCLEPSKFISAVVLSLSVMLRIALPHVNVLSKLDLLERSGALKFDLEFYMNVVDVRTLLKRIEDEKKTKNKDKIVPLPSKNVRKTFAELNQAFCDIVEDFNLVSFLAMNVEDKACMARVAKAVDTALGYNAGPGSKILSSLGDSKAFVHDLQERYVRRATEEGSDKKYL
jgi:GPN-loop GTPase